MDETQIDKLIKLLQKYEMTIAELYETFAAVFVTSKKTWTSFAAEERLHAKWIGELYSQLKNENISFEQTKITEQSTRTAINYIESQITKTKNDKQDLAHALNIAIDVEKSLLEKSYLNIFKLKGQKAQQVQDGLLKATKRHLDRLIEWRENIKSA